jgi:hypothetical protein
MVNLKIWIWAFVMTGIVISSYGKEDRVMPVYGDCFDTQALLVENWKVTPPKNWAIKNGKIFKTGKGGGTAVLKTPCPENVVVEVDVSPLELAPQFGGVSLGGVNFLIRPKSFWCVYNVKGKKRAEGDIKLAKIEKGKTYKFKVVRKKMGDAFMYTLQVDGKKIFEFIEPGKTAKSIDKLALFANGMPMSYDNLSVGELMSGDISRNLLTNSSFEYLLEDYPIYWKPSDTATMQMTFGSLDNFWKNWRIDKGVKHSGSQSLRMEIDDKTKSNGFFSHSVGVAPKKPATCSVWLKASEDNVPARLRIWEWLGKWYHKKINIDKNWKRYSFTVEAPEKNKIRFGLELKKKGVVVWADDAQVEIGKEATQYAVSALDDKLKKGHDEKIKRPETIELKTFAQSPVIDGKIEDTWRNGVVVDEFLIAGKDTPVEKTKAYLGCDDENLYIAFKAYSDQPEKMRANATIRDNGRVWADDGIEIFLDPNLDRETYYHLTFNPKGIQADVGPGRDLAWNGDWDVKTSVNKDEGCLEAEVVVPLRILDLGAVPAKEWGINLCRSNHSKKEYSCTSLFPKENFHKADHYGTVVPPKSVVAKYALTVADAKVTKSLTGNGYSICGNIGNMTGKDVDLELDVTVAGAASTKRDVSVKNGEMRPFVLAFTETVPSNPVPFTVKLLSNGKVLKEQTFTCDVSASALIYAQRNYYMNEKNALLVTELNLPNLDSFIGELQVKSSDGNAWTEKVKELKPLMRIPVPLEKVAEGENNVKLILRKNGVDAIVLDTTLTKRPYKANGVQIDRERRCLVANGKPYLAIAPLFHAFSSSREYVDKAVDHFAKAGLKTFMFCMNIKRKDFADVSRYYFEACQRNGMKVIYWPGGYGDKEIYKYGIDRLVKEVGDQPAMLAWLPVDEPELYSKPEDAIRCITAFRKADVYHPVFMNNTVMGIPARFADLTTDILCLDDYLTNRENRTVKEIVHQAVVMREIGAADRKPSHYFLVGNNLYNHHREPTSSEQVAQSYGCVIEGVTGLYYFLGHPAGRKHWEAYKRTNSELLSLSDVIFSLDQVGSASVTGKDVICMTRKHEGYVYIISVNLENKALETTVTLPIGSYEGDVEAMFENRSIKLVDGAFKDVYQPHQRHVYRIKVK